MDFSEMLSEMYSYFHGPSVDQDKAVKKNHIYSQHPENLCQTSNLQTSDQVLLRSEEHSSKSKQNAQKGSEHCGKQISIPEVNFKSSHGCSKIKYMSIHMPCGDLSTLENSNACDMKTVNDTCDSKLSKLSLTDTNPALDELICDAVKPDVPYSRVDAAVCLTRARYLLRSMDANLVGFPKEKSSKLMLKVCKKGENFWMTQCVKSADCRQ